MNYLLDRKKKRRKIFNFFIIIILVFLVVYFNKNIWTTLSGTAHILFRPVASIGISIGEKFSNLGANFNSKRTLSLENERLTDRLNELESEISNYTTVINENEKLKEILSRKKENVELILAGILSKPNISPYDTLIVDAGEREGVQEGNTVFAHGNIPIGKVSNVYSRTSKVVLFSSPGEKTEVVLVGKNTFMQVIGRGGGNFEMILPRDFVVEQGTEIHLPGITPYVLGTVASIISDPRDAFQKALLISPVNIQELKFVQIAK